jgi:secondary thiamine-phosphate synthase enzyme
MTILHINSTQPKQVIDITERVELSIQQQVMANGVVVLFIPHSHAAITTASDATGSDAQLLAAFDTMQLMPGSAYAPATVMAASLVSALVDPSLTIPVVDGKLALGIHQRLVLIETQGPQEREVTVTLLKND